MSAFVGVSRLFSEHLIGYAQKMGYTEDNLMILRGAEEELVAKFPETYANLRSCRHNADRRTPLEYGRDLVASWLLEDYLYLALRDHAEGFTVRLSGADRERKILAKAKVSATSDYEMEYQDGTRRKLELMNDYAGYWAKNGRLDLRDSKYEKLKRENALLLAIAVNEQKFTVIDFSTEVEADFIPHHPPYGFKPVYQIAIDMSTMAELKTKNLITELVKYKGL